MLSRQNNVTVLLVGEKHIQGEFERRGIVVTSGTTPTFIAISTLRPSNLAELNTVFRLMRRGVEVVAMHRNAYYREGPSIYLGLGAWVAALEEASGKRVTVVGKPNPRFFERAIERLGAGGRPIFVVGDSLENDIRPAQQAGLKTVLIRGGREHHAKGRDASVRADWVLDSIEALPGLFGSGVSSPAIVGGL
jgi:HAD superfamily hydrolase (TIGR01450 family)